MIADSGPLSLGMYFDAAVVFITNFSLLFRLALAILCTKMLGRVNISLLRRAMPFFIYLEF